MKLRINADDGLKHRYAVTQKELLDERIITQQLRENTAELPGIKAAQEVGLGGYCSPRHGMLFVSRNESSNARR